MGQKRRQHFDDDFNSSMINNEKLDRAADNVLILDYQQYVSQYLSRYLRVLLSFIYCCNCSFVVRSLVVGDICGLSSNDFVFHINACTVNNIRMSTNILWRVFFIF